MISISRLICDRPEHGDTVRYGHGRDPAAGPCRVVVWNITRACDLRCAHCYAGADGAAPAPGELSLSEGRALLDDLAAYGVQVVLFSGGEPLLHPHLLDLVDHAAAVGLRPVLSSNGMRLTPAVAARLHAAGLGYVGLSLDGDRVTHDRLRGRPGAYEGVLAAIRTGRAAGLKIGLRFTLTRANHKQLPAVFAVLEAEAVERICVYHLAHAGRGHDRQDLDHAQTRAAVDWLIDRTRALHAAGRPVEVLTVANHTDGPYLLRRLRAAGDDTGAARIAALLARGGGNSAGERIGCISWDGRVHPDQFWRHAVVGDLRQRPFSAIWSDPANTLLMQLRQRHHHLHGRCRTCAYLELCNGNLRARAAAHGDTWAPDPACYLTDDEIALTDDEIALTDDEIALTDDEIADAP